MAGQDQTVGVFRTDGGHNIALVGHGGAIEAFHPKVQVFEACADERGQLGNGSIGDRLEGYEG